MSPERRLPEPGDLEDPRAGTPGAIRSAPLVAPRSAATLAAGPGTSPVARVARPDAGPAPKPPARPDARPAPKPPARPDAGPAPVARTESTPVWDVGRAAGPLVDVPLAEPTFVRTRLVRDTALLLFGGAAVVLAIVAVAPPRPEGAVLSATGSPAERSTFAVPAAEPVTTTAPTPVPSATRATASASPGPSDRASGRPSSPRP